MCGITGIVAFNEFGKKFFENIQKANDCLSKRGPDSDGFYFADDLVFGHRRLSIIDVSASANQPMTDDTGRYTMVFNGEFFNFLSHRTDLEQKGHTFKTHSDTEVLLKLYILEGPKCLEKVNGFFALAIHDKEEGSVFIARDRMGIKPLVYFADGDKMIFGSEMKSLIAAGIPKVLDRTSILNYLQLNYIPGPWTIFQNVRKLKPGHFLLFKPSLGKKGLVEHKYYEIPSQSDPAMQFKGGYEYAQKQLAELLEASVQRRLISDVPLGAFLSGGIDSSVIVALASRHTQHLNTFSIGYKDEPLYDETRYAQLVANRYQTNHTVFSLSNDDLFENLYSALDYIDEPFADSSALAVNILSMHTRKHVTVSLSGDGADEMFAGYNKHRAEWMMRNRPVFKSTVSILSSLLKPFEGARNSKIGNNLRQIHRFADGASMSNSDRYWRWCGFSGEDEMEDLLDFGPIQNEYFSRKKQLLEPMGSGSSMNDLLYMDMKMVLTNDMLVKVDMMSMANSLEVRVPFLDYEVVNFAFSLPEEFKIDKVSSKKILRETFRKQLPDELFNRPKHGFEVPLLKWFKTDLKSLINDDILSDAFIERQGIFKKAGVKALKNRLFSSNPGDIEARIWGLIVFQYWWKKYMD